MQTLRASSFPARRPSRIARSAVFAFVVCACALAAGSASATQEPAPPPTDCASLEAYHGAWLALVPSFPEGLAGTFACWPDGAGGFWGASIGSFVLVDPTDDDPEGSAEGSYQLVRFDGGVMTEVATYPLTWQRYQRSVRTLQVSDLDRDGTVELLWTTHDDGAEAEEDQQVEVLDWVDGALVPYAPALGSEAFDAWDVDGDGVLDLFTPGPFRAEYICSLNGSIETGPAVPWVSLADGSFTTDHPAVRAYVAARCQDVLRLEWLDAWDGRVVDAIACARYAGVGADALRPVLATFADAHADECMSRAAVEGLLAVEPGLSIGLPR